MGSSKKQKRDKEREERKAEEGDFPKLKAMADGSVKQKHKKTEEATVIHTIIEVQTSTTPIMSPLAPQPCRHVNAAKPRKRCAYEKGSRR